MLVESMVAAAARARLPEPALPEQTVLLPDQTVPYQTAVL